MKIVTKMSPIDTTSSSLKEGQACAKDSSKNSFIICCLGVMNDGVPLDVASFTKLVLAK